MRTYNEYKNYPARIQALGSKIILGAFNDDLNRVVIHQLNADGSNDTTFGFDGKVYTGLLHTQSFSPSFEIIAEKDTKKITIGGISFHSSSSQKRRFERFKSDGSIDFNFVPAETAIPTAAGFSGFARTSGGEYVFTDMQSIGVDFTTRIYKLNPNGTANIEQFITGGANLIGIQSSGNSIVGNGFGQNISKYDTAFNFLDEANPNYNTYYMGAVQTDNKLVITARANNRLILFRWLAN